MMNISVSWSQAIPLNNLDLRIVPRYIENKDQIGIKTVHIEQKQNHLQVDWYSLVKELAQETYYPTYKIKARKGAIQLYDFVGRTHLYLPALWADGYITTSKVLPLWLAPEYLEMKSRESKLLFLGIFQINEGLLKRTPDYQFENIRYAKNIYNQYIVADSIKPGVSLKSRDRKDLKKFIKGFPLVHKISKTKVEIYVNGSKEKYPARIIGNEYFHFVVIDDPLNPLIVNFKLFVDEVPDQFKRAFKVLKKDLEYQVTQIHFQGN